MAEEIKNTVEIPAELPDLMKCRTLEDLMKVTGSNKVYIKDGKGYCRCVPTNIPEDPNGHSMRGLWFKTNRRKFYDCFPLNNTFTLILGWLTKDLDFWGSKVSLLTTISENVKGDCHSWDGINDDNLNVAVKKIKVEPWRKIEEIWVGYLKHGYDMIQSTNELIDVVRSKKPYAFNFFSNLGSCVEGFAKQWPEGDGRRRRGWGSYNRFTKAGMADLLSNYNSLGIQIMATIFIPNVEILAKAGYLCTLDVLDRFANQFPKFDFVGTTEMVTCNYTGRTQIDESIVLPERKSPSEILGGDKSICKFFKDVYDIEEVRDAIASLSEAHISIDELNWMFSRCFDNTNHSIDTYLFLKIRSILSHAYRGKPVISFKKLVSYLDRLDLNEAITNTEAFDLLSDYLDTCEKLDMPPKLDSDSLMREHNVADRLWLQVKDEKENELLEWVCGENAKLNYKEKEFFVRSIKDHNDLLDEAKQQHNCVASYSDKIIERRSRIYVLRKTEEPDKSLVTLEIDPRTMKVGQCYLAFNNPVKDGAIWDFIKRWDSKKIHPNRETA